jgi:drug/metabolite transporter (DMT)-like permease
LQESSGFSSICNPDFGVIMRPLGWIGVLLIIAGVVIVAMRGIPYTKSQNEVEVGPLKVTTEERGLVTPIVGVGAIVLGAVLVFAGRGRSA